jgi:hypothetical protein
MAPATDIHQKAILFETLRDRADWTATPGQIDSGCATLRIFSTAASAEYS